MKECHEIGPKRTASSTEVQGLVRKAKSVRVDVGGKSRSRHYSHAQRGGGVKYS